MFTKRKITLAVATAMAIAGLPAYAQNNDASPLEEVLVTGTQIKGADIEGTLPVSVLNSDDIALTGAATGAELLSAIPQMGFVGFSESTTTGVNAARGDVSSINLRGLGTGSTLTLINGRRMVLHPGTQTENRVPVVTANSNTIPVFGIDRLEVLRDGAAALYGSDAVAGVVNYVLQTDYEEGRLTVRHGLSEGTDLNETSINGAKGFSFNDGATNLVLTGSLYRKDGMPASDRYYSANSDLRPLFADDPLFAGDTNLDNRSSTFSGWGVMRYPGLGTLHVRPEEMTRDNGSTYSAADCSYALQDGLCLDGGSGDRALRINRNAARQLSPDAKRMNLFGFVRHDLSDATELYSEFSYYRAEVDRYREQAGPLSNGRFTVPADYYYNPFGPVHFADGRLNPNRIVPAGDADVPDEGLGFTLFRYVPFDSGYRMVNVEDTSYRFVMGAKGEFKDWDWDSGLVYSEAETVDSTNNRISSTLFQRQLMLDTADAYNIFSGLNPTDITSPFDPTPNPASAIDPMRINVKRQSQTSLALADFKVSRPDLFSLPAGDVGIAMGVEWREESFDENRDARSDGTIQFIDQVTGQYVNTSDIIGSSASPDADGSRRVFSLYAEFLVPLLRDMPLAQSLDMQLAVRHENFSDVGSVTKPKIAMSWYPIDWLQIRGAYSEGFRAPNLTQLHIPAITVVNGVNDPVSGYSGGIEERRTGNKDLKPEESKNTTIGLVLTPLDDLTLTVDYWKVEQDGIIGLLNADNAVLLDALLRQQGSYFSRLERDPVTNEPTVFHDTFQNQELREVSGIDFSASYALDTELGLFDFKWNGAYLTRFDQEPGSEQQMIIDAFDVAGGAGSLIKRNGRPRWRSTASVKWQQNQWGAGVFFQYISETRDTSAAADSDTATPGAFLALDPYLTVNTSLDYRFDKGVLEDSRLRLGVRNVFDKAPPVADEGYGYNGQIYSNRGRYIYLDFAYRF